MCSHTRSYTHTQAKDFQIKSQLIIDKIFYTYFKHCIAIVLAYRKQQVLLSNNGWGEIVLIPFCKSHYFITLSTFTGVLPNFVLNCEFISKKLK